MSIATIGVFDSGFGGLTVLRELLPLVPGAHYIYLGDTARLPYGSKSQATIARYAVESARFLEARGADQLVIACNTASALAMPEIAAAVRIPVAGVIEPVVHATQLRKPSADTLVLATAATVQSHAYRAACEAAGLHATEKACPLLVPLIEEGWVDHPVTREVLRIYLREALALCSPQVVILGCTHYPLIAPMLQRMLGPEVRLVTSGRSLAQTVAASLEHAQLGATRTGEGDYRFLCTGDLGAFREVGSRFLQMPIEQIEHIALPLAEAA